MKCVAIVISLLFAVNLFSQDQRVSKTRYYRHEVNVGTGAFFLTNAQWRDYSDQIRKDFRVGSYSNWLKRVGGLHLGYYYHLNKNLAAGMLVSFTSGSWSYNVYEKEILIPIEAWNRSTHDYETVCVRKYEWINESCGKIRDKSIFLLPTIKWPWLNNRIDLSV